MGMMGQMMGGQGGVPGGSQWRHGRHVPRDGRPWWDGLVQLPQQPCLDEHGHYHAPGPQHASHDGTDATEQPRACRTASEANGRWWWSIPPSPRQSPTVTSQHVLERFCADFMLLPSGFLILLGNCVVMPLLSTTLMKYIPARTRC